METDADVPSELRVVLPTPVPVEQPISDNQGGVALRNIDDTIRLYLVQVQVYVDPKNPKRPSREQVINRLLDGVQWMDGVLEVASD